MTAGDSGAGEPHGPVPDPADHYRLLARAVVGREVNLTGSPGSPAYCDGENIHLDQQAEAALIGWTVVVQAALLGAGSLDRTPMSRLVTARRAVTRRYLMLETVRACEQLEFVVPPSVGDAVRGLYGGPVPASAESSLKRALGPERLPAPPEWFGVIKPFKVLRTGLTSETVASSEESEAVRPTDTAEADEAGDDEGERSRILELLSAPVLTNPLSAALLRMLGIGRTPSGAGGEGELSISAVRPGAVSRRAKTVPAHLIRETPTAGPAVRGVSYPEWDWGSRTYRQQWCTVGEFDPPPAADGTAGGHPATDRRLRRELRRLGVGMERHCRQSDGDALDLTALVDFRVAAATGAGPEPAVYESRRRTGHDLGVLVLLDATGSTAEQTEGRAAFEDQRGLAWQLTAVLDELGVRVATYGFSSRGRESVRFLRAKAFDDRFDLAARSRLRALEPAGFTRLGAAYRHAARLLTTRAGTSRLLMVSIGDGFPYDDGYEARYAREDSKRALTEALAQGVGCVGIRVQPSGDDEDAMGWIWEDGVHCVARDSGALAHRARGLFGQALHRAAAVRNGARPAIDLTNIPKTTRS